MRTMWEPNMVSLVFKKLKTLNMSKSQDLTTTPDFKKLPSLQTLNLECCTSLEEVHMSIGSLASIVSLDLHGCVKLRSLPDTTCKLKALEVLDIDDCSSLEALPKGLGNLRSLIELNAGKLTVSKLPDSVGRLIKLVKLRVSSNKKLVSLPNTICDLISLEILDISGCEKLEILPEQIWKLTRLRELKAGGATNFKKIPNIESSQITLSLKRLDLSKTALTALPSSICHLSNLKYLVLRDCWCLMSIIELPPNLKWLQADGCTSMEGLLNLGNSKQLEVLDLTTCTGLTEVQGFEEMVSLIQLDLGGCNSSFLANIFTKRLFQIFSGFGHQIDIYIPSAEFPDWIRQSSNLGTTMSLDVLSNGSDDILPAESLSAESMDSINQSTDSGPTIPLDLSPNGSDNILSAESMDSINQFSDSGPTMLLDFSPNMGNNFLAAESLDSLIQSSDSDSTISTDSTSQEKQWSLDLPPNVSHNFLGMILCFNYPVDEYYIIEYSIRNTTNDFILSDSLYNSHNTGSLMVTVPRSIFPLSDGDDRVELTANIEIYGIHLLYKTE